MCAATSLRDAYREFRAKDPSYVYAFGQQAFFVFVMGDAIKVHELLPDIMIDDSPGYATIRVHSLGFYQLVYRLIATGQKVATADGRIADLERRRAELKQIPKDAGYFNDPKPLEKLGFKLISGRTHWKLQYANVRITMSKTPSDYRANLNTASDTANRCF